MPRQEVEEEVVERLQTAPNTAGTTHLAVTRLRGNVIRISYPVCAAVPDEREEGAVTYLILLMLIISLEGTLSLFVRV